MKEVVSVVVVVALVGSMVFLAPKPARAEYDRETVVAINVGIGAVIGGFGSAIHAKPGEHFLAFWKGLMIGAFGGGLTYLGKDLASQFNERKWVGWPSKFLVSAGSSIVENAYRNESWYEEFSTDFGPLFFTLKPKPEEGEKKFRMRLLPSATASLVITASEGHDFDLEKTLLVGNPVFKSEEMLGSLLDRKYSGRALNNCITIVDEGVSGKDEDSVLAHELVHTHQYRQEIVLTMPLDPFIEENASFLKLDIGQATHYGFEDWALDRDSDNRKNFFEKEADMFE